MELKHGLREPVNRTPVANSVFDNLFDDTDSRCFFKRFWIKVNETFIDK